MHERMDGSLAVYYQGHCLALRPAPLEAPVLRVRNMVRVIPNMTDSGEPAVAVIAAKKTLPLKPSCYTKPDPGHPWRRPFKVHIDRGVTN